jgi:exonuclease III
MGDFNALAPEEAELAGPGPAKPEDHEAAVRGGVVGAVLAAGYVDSFRLANPYDGLAVSTLRHRPAWRVDHIFVSPALAGAVRRSYIVDTDAVAKASDHKPVVTELELSGL